MTLTSKTFHSVICLFVLIWRCADNDNVTHVPLKLNKWSPAQTKSRGHSLCVTTVTVTMRESRVQARKKSAFSSTQPRPFCIYIFLRPLGVMCSVPQKSTTVHNLLIVNKLRDMWMTKNDQYIYIYIPWQRGGEIVSCHYWSLL